MATKKQIIKNHKKSKKVNKIAHLFESVDRTYRTFTPLFEAHYTSDTCGWYKKLVLKASKGGSWTKDLVGRPIVALEYFDGDCILNLKYDNEKYKIKLPVFALHDIATAASVFNEFNEKHMFTKVKMKKKK